MSLKQAIAFLYILSNKQKHGSTLHQKDKNNNKSPANGENH